MSLLKAAASSRARAGYVQKRSMGKSVVGQSVGRRMVKQMASDEQKVWRKLVSQGMEAKAAKKEAARRVKWGLA